MESRDVDACSVPERLRSQSITLSFAAQIAGKTKQALWLAVHEGRLKATPCPAGEKHRHWQVALGDLVEYTGKPLSAEWLAVVEECLNWKPGEEVRRQLSVAGS